MLGVCPEHVHVNTSDDSGLEWCASRAGLISDDLGEHHWMIWDSEILDVDADDSEIVRRHYDSVEQATILCWHGDMLNEVIIVDELSQLFIQLAGDPG